MALQSTTIATSENCGVSWYLPTTTDEIPYAIAVEQSAAPAAVRLTPIANRTRSTSSPTPSIRFSIRSALIMTAGFSGLFGVLRLLNVAVGPLMLGMLVCGGVAAAGIACVEAVSSPGRRAPPKFDHWLR